MKEYFTKSSDLLKKQMRGGSNTESWGAQNHDPQFPDSLETTVTPNEVETCYRDMNEASGAPFHSEWDKSYCNQSGGNNHISKYGAQSYDPQFSDSVAITIPPNGIETCYRDMNEASGPPFHSEWGKSYCHKGGSKSKKAQMSRDEYMTYKAYKKYKMKYKMISRR